MPETSTPRKRASRRGEIVESFTRMVAENGYDAVAIRDLAEDLGMSKGTVLHHFGSKDRLLEEVHSTYMRRRLDEIALILAELDGPQRRLKAMVFQNLIAMQQDADATRAFAREIVRFSREDLMNDVRAMRREYFDTLRGILDEGMEQGAFRRADTTIVALQLFGMMNWTWTWFDPAGEVSVESIARTFLDTVLHGLDSGAEPATAGDAELVELVRSTIASVAEREAAAAAPAKA
ncbi:MAG: TetR/AcrR family transcriptional regulator, cholesterol catabolism regulator [Solirubrobacterales bacterium]|jgi:AcrR family transcriptional regulator|nr:TetR/AcrR family transcriptional regulator, cholesterol catabolism regulator [Solirubrobacterales bacterium]